MRQPTGKLQILLSIRLTMSGTLQTQRMTLRTVVGKSLIRQTVQTIQTVQTAQTVQTFKIWLTQMQQKPPWTPKPTRKLRWMPRPIHLIPQKFLLAMPQLLPMLTGGVCRRLPVRERPPRVMRGHAWTDPARKCPLLLDLLAKMAMHAPWETRASAANARPA